MTVSAMTAQAKSALRAAARDARAGLAPVRRQAAAAVAGNGLGFLGLPAGATVAGYHPVREELDPLPLLGRLARAGMVTALPAVAADASTLLFRHWRPGEALEPGRYGIPAPLEQAAVAVPDVVLVPLLAFDAAGHRLGYGAGFYDRALSRLRGERGVVAVGLAFDEQEVAHVPHGASDQRLDWILTPAGPRAFES